MKNERLGVLIVSTTLLVVALITGLLIKHVSESRSNQIRIQGMGLVRSLSSIPFEHLAAGSSLQGLLPAVISIQSDPDFGYGIVVDTHGKTLVEIAAPGIQVPSAIVPSEPAFWFGERYLDLPDDSGKIREFYGPVFTQGQLAGFIRLGYVESGGLAGWGQLSMLGMMVLSILLLTALFYVRIRRHIPPLTGMSRQLEELIVHPHAYPKMAEASGSLHTFIDRFKRFSDASNDHLRALEAQRASATATHGKVSDQKAKVAAVLNEIPEALIVLDESGVATFANAKLEPLIGISPKIIVGARPDAWVEDSALLAFITRLVDHPARAFRGDSLRYAPAVSPHKHITARAYPLITPQDNGPLFGTVIVFCDESPEIATK